MSSFKEDDSFGEASLLEIVQGDRELAVELTQIFLSELEPRIREIQAAIRSGDARELRSAAHALKGSAASVSGKAVAATALSLEHLGANGTVEGAEALFPVLESRAADLRERLVAFAHNG
jgi:HPt (histidine-containing phosphotransfer) domain-containing protein